MASPHALPSSALFIPPPPVLGVPLRLFQVAARKRFVRSGTCPGIRAFFPNPDQEQPILKEALKEPVAFLGGVVAGLLRLDLNEEPLKGWVSKTVEASGINISGDDEDEEEAPKQIQIE